jgi:type VI protein secretion system component VasK
MANAAKLQAALYSGRPATLRISGRPTRGLERTGYVAKRRTLELVCGDGTQRLEYREGPPVPKAFRWDPSCQEVTLIVLLAAPDGGELRVQDEWRGPLALPSFLRGGARSPSGPDVFEWELRADSQRFRVPFAIPLSGDLRDLQHRPPPPATSS